MNRWLGPTTIEERSPKELGAGPYAQVITKDADTD